MSSVSKRTSCAASRWSISASVSVIAAANRAGSSSWLPTWKLNPPIADAALERPLDQVRGFERPDAELRRQVALRVRAAVREPDEEPHVVRGAGELVQLDLVVDDEGAHARGDRLGDLGRLLDRVRVDDALGLDPLEQRQLLARRDVEAASLVGERRDHRVVRERLDRVVEAHERQRRGEPAVLAAHALGVQQQHGRAVQGDRGLRDVGGEQRRGLVAADVADRARGARLRGVSRRRS